MRFWAGDLLAVVEIGSDFRIESGLDLSLGYEIYKNIWDSEASEMIPKTIYPIKAERKRGIFKFVSMRHDPLTEIEPMCI
jgi:hypothetical protein